MTAPSTAFSQLVWQCGKAGLRVGLLLEPAGAEPGRERVAPALLQIIVYRQGNGVREVGWCSSWVEAGAALEVAAVTLLTRLAGKGLIA